MHTHVVKSPCQCKLRSLKLDKAPATDSRSRYNKFITGKARPCRYRIYCHMFDHEPSRLPVKRMNRLLNKSRETRWTIRKQITKEFPKSSWIHEWTRKSKMEGDLKYARHTFKTKKNYFKHMHCLFLAKRKVQLVLPIEKRKKIGLADACVRKKAVKQQIPIERTTKLKVFGKSDLFYPSSPLSCKGGHTERFSSSREMLIMSGDIELNPGPKEIENTRKSPLETLQVRLAENGLRYLDCGSESDCFLSSYLNKVIWITWQSYDCAPQWCQLFNEQPRKVYWK